MSHKELTMRTLQEIIEEIENRTLIIEVTPKNLNVIIRILKDLDLILPIYTKSSSILDSFNYIKLFDIIPEINHRGKTKIQKVYDYFMEILNKGTHQGKLLFGIYKKKILYPDWSNNQVIKPLILTTYHSDNYNYLKNSNDYIFLEDLKTLSSELKNIILGRHQVKYYFEEPEIRLESLKKRTLKGN